MSDEGASEVRELSGDFFRRLCDHAAVALVATDATRRIVCWNAAAEKLLRRPAAEMMGRSVFEVVPQARQRLFERLLERTTDRGVNSQFDVRLPDGNGHDRHLSVLLSPIPGRDASSRGVAAWVVDETHRKQLAEQLAQTEKIASLGTLAGGVAHHFNNILGGVATFVDYALTSGDAAAMKRALQMTAEAAARVSKITQSLLSFAEHDSQRSDMADLTEVVLTFSHLVERPLSEKGIQLALDLRPVPIVPVEANRMHQVLGNLLTNAEEAMPDGGTVTIAVERRGSEVALIFTDNGVGIEPSQLPLVFEPFFTTKGLLAGGDKANPGLGLSVVHGIVTEMNGRIDAESTDEGGARFVISFAASES
jgi:two-component system, NtrC family, sensor kinase